MHREEIKTRKSARRTHDGGEQEGSGVGLVLALNVGSATVDGLTGKRQKERAHVSRRARGEKCRATHLKDRSILANVARGCKTKTTNETSAHVGKNVTCSDNRTEITTDGKIDEGTEGGMAAQRPTSGGARSQGYADFTRFNAP